MKASRNSYYPITLNFDIYLGIFSRTLSSVRLETTSCFACPLMPETLWESIYTILLMLNGDLTMGVSSVPSPGSPIIVFMLPLICLPIIKRLLRE
jgi:hypothetical protein